MDDKAKAVVRDWGRLDGDRRNFMVHWQDVANYILPDRNDYIVDKPPGIKRMTYIYDATPCFALDMNSAGMHSLLTSNTLQWFILWTENDRINQDPDVHAWLEAAALAMYRVFNSSRMNFAAASHELYLDLGSIGTACMNILEHWDGDILFDTRHMKEVVIGLDEKGRVARVIRKWMWTARQAVDEWGLDEQGQPLAGDALRNRLGEQVAKAWVEDPDGRRFEFAHDVKPRAKRDPQRSDKRNKPFESIYVAVDDKHTVAEGGFDQFPYVVPRATKLTSENYGRGRGMIMLPDVKMLNEIVKTTLKGAQKVVDPPLQAPDEGFLVPIKTLPGSMNYYRANSQGRIEPIKTEGQTQLGIEIINSYRQQIMRGFYVDQMMMPTDLNDPASSGKGVTATYTSTWLQQVMRMLSPQLARSQSEFTGPSIDLVFPILWRQSQARGFNQDPARGKLAPFPPPPALLRGQRLRVEYVSPIALAQKSAQMDAVAQVVQMQAQLRQMDPNGQLIIDKEMCMRITARDRNAPAGLLRSPKVLADERQQQAEQQQAMQQHEAAANLAGAAKDGTEALGNLAALKGGQQPERAAA